MPLPELKHNQLRKLAKELWEGSYEAHSRYLQRAYLSHEFATDNQVADEILADLTGRDLKRDRWDFGPDACSTSVFDENSPLLSHSEFIGGIAVACGIEPEQSDIDTVVFMLGKHWGENG